MLLASEKKDLSVESARDILVSSPSDIPVTVDAPVTVEFPVAVEIPLLVHSVALN